LDFYIHLKAVKKLKELANGWGERKKMEMD